MLSDPYMLRTYVGLDIQSASNASEPLLQLAYKEDEHHIRVTTPAQQTASDAQQATAGAQQASIPVQHILEQNPYYRDCVRMLDDSHVPSPKGFGWRDALITALYVMALLTLACLIWQTDGLLFTVLTVIYCISVPFTVLPVTENLPYVREEIRYEEMLEAIKRRESVIAKKYNKIVI